MSEVRWNPLVFEPSTTVFRMVWTASTGFASSIAETVRATSSASESCVSGGLSSSSIKPEFGDWM